MMKTEQFWEEYFADLIVDCRIIVELKAVVKILNEQVAQTLGY